MAHGGPSATEARRASEDFRHRACVALAGGRRYSSHGRQDFTREEIDMAFRINHIHLIDSDNTCHKDDKGEDETSAHPPFGRGFLNFDEIMPELLKAARVPHNWWTIDLCFWPDAWAATESCKKYMDGLVAKYGGASTETTHA